MCPTSLCLLASDSIVASVRLNFIIVYLSKREFIPFRERLLEDEPNITKYQEDMFIDENGVFHVLMYCCIQCDVMLLVYSDGEKYAKYCSIKSNGGVKVEPRFTTSQRYSRK